MDNKTFNFIFDYIDDGYIKKDNIISVLFKDDGCLISTNTGKKIFIDKHELIIYKLKHIIKNIY